MRALLFGASIGVLYMSQIVVVNIAFSISLFLDSEVRVLARSYKQYLAVAPFPTRSHLPEIGSRVPRPAKACVQIWTLAPAGDIHHTADKGPDMGLMKCELVLCLDSGAAQEVRWCPLPSHDLVSFRI